MVVWITPEAEKQILYMARVSGNQENTDPGLITYLLKHKHLSPFEMVCACVEIETTRAIAPQILRHRSFSFQEFSQRYANATNVGFEQINPRKQDKRNRQNSFDTLDAETKEWFQHELEHVQNYAIGIYEEALERGIAKESARFILPGSQKTRIYMQGTLRSWLTYWNVRLDISTQKEHRDIAMQTAEWIAPYIPNIMEATNNLNNLQGNFL